MVREGRVLISVNTDPDFGSNYIVQVLEVGAQVASASSGTTITVRAGHGFAAGDKFMKSTGAGYSGTVTVSSVGATTLNLSGSYSVSSGDVLLNLGQDTGIASPNYVDSRGAGFPLAAYADMDYSNLLGTAGNVFTTADAQGRYRYFHKSILRWELVRNGTAVVALYADAGAFGVAGPLTSTDNAIARWDQTSGSLLQDSSGTLSDTGDLAVATVTTTGAASVGGALTAASASITGNATLATNSALILRDANQKVYSSASGELDISSNSGSQIIELDGAIVRTSTSKSGPRLVSSGPFVYQQSNLGLTANSTTPSVLLGNSFYTQNSSGTAITNFTNGTIGQRIVIVIQDTHTSFTNGATLKLAGAVNWTTTNVNDTFEAIFDGGVWYECGRSQNH